VQRLWCVRHACCGEEQSAEAQKRRSAHRTSQKRSMADAAVRGGRAAADGGPWERAERSGAEQPKNAACGAWVAAAAWAVGAGLWCAWCVWCVWCVCGEQQRVRCVAERGCEGAKQEGKPKRGPQQLWQWWGERGTYKAPCVKRFAGRRLADLRTSIFFRIKKMEFLKFLKF